MLIVGVELASCAAFLSGSLRAAAAANAMTCSFLSSSGCVISFTRPVLAKSVCSLKGRFDVSPMLVVGVELALCASFFSDPLRAPFTLETCPCLSWVLTRLVRFFL